MSVMPPQREWVSPSASTSNKEGIRVLPMPAFDETDDEDREDDRVALVNDSSLTAESGRRDVSPWLDEASSREMLLARASAMQFGESSEEADQYGGPSFEARSSMSSPGRSTLRHRLQRRLLLEHRQRNPERYRMEQARLNPPPPPPTTLSTNQDILLSYNSTISEDLDDDSSPSSPKSVVPRRPSPTKSPSPLVLAARRSHAAPTDWALATSHMHPETSASLLRLSRQMHYSKRGRELRKTRANRIKLHIYDLIHDETMMELPFGCECPVGACFSAVNTGLHALGTGAYHCGVEVNNIEYAYGASQIEGITGVFTCVPTRSPGYQYRTTLDFGFRRMKRRMWVKVDNEDGLSCGGGSNYHEIETSVDGREIIIEMASEYLGVDYDLLRRNCCTFARDACLRLGVKEEEIPTWFMNLAETGAATHDIASLSVLPITTVLSMMSDEDNNSVVADEDDECDSGFEVISLAKDVLGEKENQDTVRVVDAEELRKYLILKDKRVRVRRAMSWTY